MRIGVLASVVALGCATTAYSATSSSTACKDPSTGHIIRCPAGPSRSIYVHPGSAISVPPRHEPPPRGSGGVYKPPPPSRTGGGYKPPPPSPPPSRTGGGGYKPPPPPPPWDNGGSYYPPQPPPAYDGGVYYPPSPPQPPPPTRTYAPPLPRPSPAEAQIAGALLERGPIVSPPSAGGPFQVRGFIRPGWPVVVDFVAQPDTRTALKVSLLTPNTVAGEPPQRYDMWSVIDPDGRRGRRLFRLDANALPWARDVQGGPAVRIADFAIESYRISGGQLLLDQNRRSTTAPVRVLGFGAGPRAIGSRSLAIAPPDTGQTTAGGLLTKVSFNSLAEKIDYQSEGSVSITEVDIGPQLIHRPSARNAAVPAKFSYLAKQEFYQIDADIWPECLTGACNTTSAVRTFATRPVSAPEHVTGAWNILSNTPAGSYDLYVRAWLHCNGAPADSFHDCADEAAWAYGRAGPIEVAP